MLKGSIFKHLAMIRLQNFWINFIKKSAIRKFCHFLFWNVHTFSLIDFGVPKMGFLVFLLGGIWRGVTTYVVFLNTSEVRKHELKHLTRFCTDSTRPNRIVFVMNTFFPPRSCFSLPLAVASSQALASLKVTKQNPLRIFFSLLIGKAISSISPYSSKCFLRWRRGSDNHRYKHIPRRKRVREDKPDLGFGQIRTNASDEDLLHSFL